MTNGKTITPHGTKTINDSHGDKPAFLQINQNGKMPSTVTNIPTMKIMINSGIPNGPICVFY